MSGADRELGAMSAIAAAMDGLDESEVERVLRWAADRFGPSQLLARGADQRREGGEEGGDHEEPAGYEDIYALFDGTAAHTDADRVVLAGYWFQVLQGSASFTGAQVNDSLRQMGVPAANITKVFNRLIARKPSLVLQVSKSGRAAQARKQYRLTTAGIAAARQLLAGGSEDEG